ncbi:MAG: sulfotransferase family 2 domain-containing protein [Marinibacterium sp.]
MPFFKIDRQLVYYAHVPKCGGSSIANYLRDRFGALAFYNTGFHDLPETARWTRSSPQHVDAASLAALIPAEFFSAAFAFVRHPVARVISSYHFQAEVEGLIDETTGFSDWLAGLADRADREGGDPFAFDNHVRPMSDIVPDGATVFHMEHGVDQLIPWLDRLAGQADGPRAIPPENIRGQYTKDTRPDVVPTPDDLGLIERIYAADFDRFGYRISDKAPLAPPPDLDPGFVADRDRALAAASRPIGQLRRKIRRKLQNL